MKKFLFFILLALGALCAPVNAQQQMQALVVSSCGSVSYTAATYGFVTMDTTGKVCDSGGGGGGGAVTLPTMPTVANGNGVVPAPSSETLAGLSTSATPALASNLAVKASAGNLYSFDIAADSTLSGAAWWLMIFNLTSAPADGAVTPAKCYSFPLGTTNYAAAFPVPVNFSTGIVLVVSTTGCFTKTASAHAFLSGDYK
jgi:hypothetical protein